VPLRIGGGTRLKILEAAAVGTPVVSTSKGAEGLALAPGRDLLIGDTPEAFAQATVRLLEDPGLGRRLAASARRIVEQSYVWDRVGAQLNDLILEAVANARRGVPTVKRGERARAVGA
jgi:glycosyltransferase involved in cell wall biosynthesis